MTSNHRAVVRVHYDAVRDVYSCCIVEAGECLAGSRMDLEEKAAAEHYECATENGTCYEAFPGTSRA
jgi:hypothetical protein